MGATGGSVEAISFDGREFAVAADSDVTIKIGGFENEQSSNGNATTRQLKTRVAWAVTGLNVSVDHSNGDLEYLQDRSDAKGNGDFTITLVDGTVYQGEGSINGEVAGSSASTTVALNFGGPGKLTAQ